MTIDTDRQLEDLARTICHEYNLPVSRVPRFVAVFDKALDAGVKKISEDLRAVHHEQLRKLGRLGKWTPEAELFFESRRARPKPKPITFRQLRAKL